jgi:hypothetical protein
MVQPLNGHPQGGPKQRNTMTDSVRDVHTWSQKHNILIITAKNTQNID